MLPTERPHIANDWSRHYGYPDDVVNEGLYRLGDAVYEARRRAGWTQRQLATRSGIDQPTISRLERGMLPGISLRRLAVLFVALDDLLNLRRG